MIVEKKTLSIVGFPGVGESLVSGFYHSKLNGTIPAVGNSVTTLGKKLQLSIPPDYGVILRLLAVK